MQNRYLEHRWRQRMAPLLLVLAVGLTVASGCDTASDGGSSGSGDPTASDDARSVDRNTRAYLNKISTCQTAVGLVLLDARSGKVDDFQLADDATQARDICDEIRSQVVSMDTDHFDDEAATGFYAVDRYKSGLNAILTYIDNPAPTKIIEARDKLQEGDMSARQARRDINGRRHVYGLRSYRP